MNYFYNIPEQCLAAIRDDVPEAECFRVTRHNPPVQDDFRPQLFQVPPDERAAKAPCTMCGASVFTDIKSAKNVLRKFKKLGKYIFCGHVQSAEHGPLTCAGGEYHYNWFQYARVNPSKVFSEKVSEQ